MIHKLAFVPLGIFFVTQAVRAGAEGIILAATTVAAVGYLWMRIVVPARRFSRRIGRGIDLLEELPDFRREVTDHLSALDSQVAVLADADKHRIKDAIAGDQRSPLDRRAA